MATKFPHYVLLGDENQVIAIIAGSENHKAKVTQAMEEHYDAEVTSIEFKEQDEYFVTPGKATIAGTVDLEEYDFTLVPATMYQ